MNPLLSCLLLWWSAAAPAPAGAKWSLDDVLKRMQQTHDAVQAIQAKLVQERAIPLLEEKERRRGAVYFMKPRKLLIEFDQPEKVINLLDGDRLTVYKPALKQAEIYRLDQKAGGRVRAVGLGFMDSVDKAKADFKFKLLGEETAGDKRFILLQLTPRPGREEATKPYNKIILWVDPERWTPIRIRLFESDGEVITTIRFSDIQLKKSAGWLFRRKFKLNLPRDVEIIRPLD